MNVAMPQDIDLTECDREPITRLEHIQAFGFLLALSKDWNVVRASANLGAILGVEAADAIGMPLDRLIDAEALHDIRNRIVVLRVHHGSERLYGVRLLGTTALFDLALHDSGDLLVLEGEPSGASEGPDAASLVRAMVNRLNTKKTLTALHRDCARQVRALIGFNRVMIYRFDDSGAGEVIAESINGIMESFEGLRFPSADIPVQARALYLRNPFRIIGDVDAISVPLLPLDTAEALDLSLAVTRAVSPIHIEYLRNMHVAASLSISIIVEGRLWGLIACHNETARMPAFAKRSASELFAQMYSMILESRTRQVEGDRERVARSEVDRMIGSIASDRRLLQNPEWLYDTLREIMACDGVAVAAPGLLATIGETPSAESLATLVVELGLMPAAQLFSTDRLAKRFPQAVGAGARVAGMLAIPTSLGSEGWIFLFRRERVKEVNWGGDPSQAHTKVEPGTRISPRQSFQAFAIVSRDQSPPFTTEDLRTAEMIRSALIEIVSRMKTGNVLDEERTADRQNVLIAELNHRVRNILALIRGLINQTTTGEGDVASYVESLNGRVQALARAHDQITRQNDWGPGLLSTLFEHEVIAYVPTQLERFQVRGPAVYLLPEAFSTLALVVHELFTNSLKYGALSDSGCVEVAVTRRNGDGLHLAWRDIDGPLVRAPTRRGFGSAIIERTIPFDLQGTVEVRYPPTGIEVDLFVPEQFIWTGAVTQVGTALSEVPLAHVVSDRPLEGMSVLLLEDNMIVALQTEDLLRDLGASSVHAVPTILAAIGVLDRTPIDFAVLDVNVGSGTSLDFALICVDRAIPFIFASGYGSDVDLGNDYRSVPIVIKPYSIGDVARAAGAALLLSRPQRTSGPVCATDGSVLH